MIERVYAQVSKARLVTRVIIATDDDRIYRAASAFGAEAVGTSPEHASGTDRVAEVAAAVPEASIVVNVQGDEPFLDPGAIDQAVGAMLADRAAQSSARPPAPVYTLMTALDPKDARDPNVVKVVCDLQGCALYFSRASLPYIRDAAAAASPTNDAARNAPFMKDAAEAGVVAFHKHLGLYVYERDFLIRFPKMCRGPLEAAEKLEQLRVLENGYRIRVVFTAHDSLGVDTEEDLERARARARALDEQGQQPGYSGRVAAAARHGAGANENG